MLLLTTSRRPLRKIRTFCHDLTRSIPNIIRINRGKLGLVGVVEKALEFKADRIIIVDRWNGGPGKIKLFQIWSEGLIPFPPLIYVMGTRLQREFEGAKIMPIRSLVITTSTDNPPQVMRATEALSNFLNVPMSSTNEAFSKYQASMHFSIDASYHTQVTFMLLSQTIELGPRVIVSLMVWEIRR